MGLFKRKSVEAQIETVASILALITHPDTCQTERNAAMAAYERVTGQVYNIVTARRHLAVTMSPPEPQRSTPKRSQPVATPHKQEASSYATSCGYTADAICTASRACEITGQNNTYGNSFGGNYNPGGSYSSADGLCAEYDAACVGDY